MKQAALGSLKDLLSESCVIEVAGLVVRLVSPSLDSVGELMKIRRQEYTYYENFLGKDKEDTNLSRLKAAESDEAIELSLSACATALFLTLDPVHEIMNARDARRLVIRSGGVNSDLCQKALELCGEVRRPEEKPDDRPT